MNLPQRIRDLLLERRIAKSSEKLMRTLQAWGLSHRVFRRAARDHDKLIAQRSPQQLARMKGMGE